MPLNGIRSFTPFVRLTEDQFPDPAISVTSLEYKDTLSKNE